MKPSGPVNLPELEAQMLKLWDEEKTFQQSLDHRAGAEVFSFYDGPPFTNGLPHYGHVVPSTIKDAIARYKTMRGYLVPRVAGWDTHGLPVEYEVEKQLGLTGKQQILTMGVDKFTQACRDSVFRYKGEFEDFIRRLGRWLDLEHPYATLDDNYIESVWWVFGQLHQKDLIYQGFRGMPYCPRCATPLSNFELNQGYKDDVEDPSVYVKFQLTADDDTSLLAWTTTPWTLPANAALAVDSEADYVTVELQDDGDSWHKAERLILAQARLDALDLRKAEYKVVKTHKGTELVGLEYRPLIAVDGLKSEERAKAYRVYTDASVSLEDGTGVLHIAPRYGEDDLALGLREGLPLIESVDGFGMMTDLVPTVTGAFFKEADPAIIAELEKSGRIFAAETFRHTYPFCWRCDTPLMYFATPSWFVKVTNLIDRLVANNQQIKWVPSHIKDGRFGNWLAEARDWSVSRNRYWGAPIPIWRCGQDHLTVVGSLEELRQRAINLPDKLDLHRPGIDAIKLRCADCDGEASRIEEVFDCWFESGAMPYAQGHYPFEHKQQFQTGFPAQFISEGLDQTRGWFYTLHVLGTALFDKPAFINVICHGIVVAADGQKLSKRLRNYPPLDEVFDQYGADVLRFFMMTSPVVGGEDVRFGKEALQEVERNFFGTLWNVYSFLATYAKAQNWQPPAEPKQPESANVLDVWILTRLNQTIAEMTKQADAYQIARATRPLVELVDDLSNWYLRRSRRRFSKAEDSADQASAFATLHYVLVRVCQLLAPWAPFLSDHVYRELTEHKIGSVHLSNWPEAGQVDPKILAEMSLVRDSVTEGLAQRAAAGVKVRQPLATVSVSGTFDLPLPLQDLIRDELNVKSLVYRVIKERQAPQLDTTVTPELASEGLAREVIRHVQMKRREVGLVMGQSAMLELATGDAELRAAIEHWGELIETETTTSDLKLVEPNGTDVPVAIGSAKLEIKLATG